MNVGDKLIIVAEWNLFDSIGIRNMPPLSNAERKAHARAAMAGMRENLNVGIYLVRLEIIETRKVNGTYRPEDQHDGYRAKGSDGWYYQCQWNQFDDASTDPYSNWHREYVDGVHYTINKETNRIDKFLIDEEKDFKGHYLNWDIQSISKRMTPELQQEVMQFVNEKWPDAQLFVCDKSHTNHDDQINHHDTYGLQYKHKGCWMCEFLSRQRSVATAIPS